MMSLLPVVVPTVKKYPVASVTISQVKSVFIATSIAPSTGLDRFVQSNVNSVVKLSSIHPIAFPILL